MSLINCGKDGFLLQFCKIEISIISCCFNFKKKKKIPSYSFTCFIQFQNHGANNRFALFCCTITKKMFVHAIVSGFKDTVSLVVDDQNGVHIIFFSIFLFVVEAPTLNSIDFEVGTIDAFFSPVILIHLMYGHRFAMNQVYPHEHIVYWHFYLICDLLFCHGHWVPLILALLNQVSIVNY